MTIAGIRDWCKAQLERIPTHALAVSAGLLALSAAFGLGILVGSGAGESPGLSIANLAASSPALPLQAAASAVPPSGASRMTQGGQVVASKGGAKYYFPWCGTVKRIKEENKVWFESREAAEAAGYAPASNCKGM